MNVTTKQVFFIIVFLLVFCLCLYMLNNEQLLNYSISQEFQTQSFSEQFTVKNIGSFKINKFNTIERYLIDDYKIRQNETHYVIKIKINQNKYQWLKDALENPTLQKCFAIEGIVQEENPNFDCNNPIHRNLLLTKLDNYINKGLKLIDRGEDKGYVNRNGYVITIILPKDYNVGNQVHIGEDSIVLEYENISLIEYKSDYFNVNTTLEEGDLNRANYAVNYPDVMIVDNSSLKFGATRNNASDNLEFRYIFESDKPIFKDNFGYYIDGEQTKIGNIITYDRHYIKTDDICYSLFNESTNETYFDSNCVYDYYSEVIESKEIEDELLGNYTLNTSHYFLEVYFTGYYNGSSLMFIDPSYYIFTFSIAESYDVNVTQENNFSHLDINDESPYNNLILYLPFDQDFDNYDNITYDYSDENNDGTATNGALFKDNCGGTNNDNCLNIYSNNGYVEVPHNSNLALTGGTGTIIVILNESTVAGTNDEFVSHSRDVSNNNEIGWSIWRVNDVRCGFAISNGTGSATQKIQTDVQCKDTFGKYRMLAGTINGTQMRLYYIATNGSLSYITTTQNVNPRDYATFNIVVGSSANKDRNFVDAEIKEVMIFNTSLTQSQLQDIWDNSSARFKNPGTQTFNKINITEGNNTVNITANVQNYHDSYVEDRIGYWDVSDGYNDTIDGVDYDLNDGLKLYYHFDNRSGYDSASSIYDFSGNNYNGTVTGSILNSSDGVFNNSFYFDGSSDRITNSEIDNFYEENFTASVWVKVLGHQGTYRGILNNRDHGYSDGFVLYITTGNTYDLWLYTGSALNVVNTGYTLTLDKWELITFGYNGTHGLVYINGELAKAEAQSHNESVNDFDVGNVAGGFVFDGNLDEVMLWNRSLSDDEIKELYIKGKANWNYGDWQNVSDEVSNAFTINSTSTDILPEYRFNGGNLTEKTFYSPVLFAPILIETYTTSGGGGGGETTVSECSTLSTENETYLLDTDITNNDSSTCFNIQADNVLFNCQGHIIDGIDADNSRGFVSSGYNTTLRNCYISDWEWGSYFTNTNNLIENNTFNSNDRQFAYGVLGIYANNTIVNNNTITNGYGGILHDENWYSITKNNYIENMSDIGIFHDMNPDHSIVENNTVINSTKAFLLYYADNVTIRNNYFDSDTGIEIKNFGKCDASDYTQICDFDINNNIYNNIFNASTPVSLTVNINTSHWNTTLQTGYNIYNSSNTQIGGNFWTNATNTGYSNTCTDADTDGFCDLNYTLNSDNIDYLPLSDEFSTGGADTCTYSGSGTWNIDCSDNCVLNTDTNVQNNIINITGIGIVNITSGNIINVSALHKYSTTAQCPFILTKSQGGSFRLKG